MIGSQPLSPLISQVQKTIRDLPFWTAAKTETSTPISMRIYSGIPTYAPFLLQKPLFKKLLSHRQLQTQCSSSERRTISCLNHLLVLVTRKLLFSSNVSSSRSSVFHPVWTITCLVLSCLTRSFLSLCLTVELVLIQVLEPHNILYDQVRLYKLRNYMHNSHELCLIAASNCFS